MTELLGQLAKRVDSAAQNATAIAQLSNEVSLSIADAYQVQNLSIMQRIQRGERVMGVKMGFTSRAKMLQMGVEDLILGQLTDAMLIDDGGKLDLSRFIHPRVEPEIAFLLNKPLSGKVSIAEAMTAVAAVAPALEVIDSRYDNFKFSLVDVIADNCSSAGFCVGTWHSVNQGGTLDISNLGMVMEFDGRAVQIGSSAAILGNPWRSLVEASRLAAAVGSFLPAGCIVLAGAATAAEALVIKARDTCHVRLQTQALGAVEFSANMSQEIAI